MDCKWSSRSKHLFLWLFACSVVLLFYINYEVFTKTPQTATSDYSSYSDIEQIKYNKNENTHSSFSELTYNGSSPYMTLIPIMDFKDLGSAKEKLLLLILVSTAPGRFKRRQAVRDTWWKHCNGSQVKCFFVTDGYMEDMALLDLMIKERLQYKDMELQPLQGGQEFGLRFLKQIKWAMAKFNFQYILRIDDDYFLCLKALLSELQVRPKENLVWGNFHCEANIAWVDESFMIFTQDIIVKFLSQSESTMLCHPQADQQIGLWLNIISTKQFFHDTRLYHGKPASFTPLFKKATKICDSYLGVHGSYEELMQHLGQNSNDMARVAVHPIPAFSTFCKTTTFDYRVILPPFYFEPKLCKDNPRWILERGMYVGRENNT